MYLRKPKKISHFVDNLATQIPKGVISEHDNGEDTSAPTLGQFSKCPSEVTQEPVREADFCCHLLDTRTRG